MTASVTGSPRYVSASRFSFCSTRALISCGVYFLPSISPDFQVVPISRLTLRMVRSTLVTAWFLADWPTRTSPFLANATTDGVVREPSEFAMTVGSPPSRTVTTELVVPRSIPTARAMGMASLPCTGWCRSLVWSARKPVDHLAPGPLNFPAQTNGRDRDRVPRSPEISPPALQTDCPTSPSGRRPHPRACGRRPDGGDRRPQPGGSSTDPPVRSLGCPPRMQHRPRGPSPEGAYRDPARPVHHGGRQASGLSGGG